MMRVSCDRDSNAFTNTLGVVSSREALHSRDAFALMSNVNFTCAKSKLFIVRKCANYLQTFSHN